MGWPILIAHPAADPRLQFAMLLKSMWGSANSFCTNLTHVLHFCFREDEFSDFTFLSQRVAHFRDPDMLSRGDSIPYPYPVPSVHAFVFFIRLFSRPLAHIFCSLSCPRPSQPTACPCV